MKEVSKTKVEQVRELLYKSAKQRLLLIECNQSQNGCTRADAEEVISWTEQRRPDLEFSKWVRENTLLLCKVLTPKMQKKYAKILKN